ncbi:MAG: FemAB family XrtA/PEP-CTERM system-associated protein [Planctomycetota bacterium]|jgi:FemAB-related protein (PEP-CTERM system-associated)
MTAAAATDPNATRAAALPMVSVVIPITTGDVSLQELVESYSQPLAAAGYPHEVVAVLDGVAGRYERAARTLAAEYPLKTVALHGGGLGESVALSAGVEHALGDLIVNVPPYLQAEPEDLLKVVRGLESGNDVVATWRHPRVDPWLNQLQSRLFNWVMGLLMGAKYHDLNSGMRGLRRHVMDEISVYGEMYRFLPVFAQRQGFKVVEVKVRHREERGRRGFYGVGVYIRRLLDITAVTFLTRFTQKPLRFFGMLGLLAMLVGLALCIEPVYSKVIHDKSIANRPLFFMGTILAAFGVQLIGFGLVGEIIIFTQARNIRDYQVDEVLEGAAAEPPGDVMNPGVEAAPTAADAANPDNKDPPKANAKTAGNGDPKTTAPVTATASATPTASTTPTAREPATTDGRAITVRELLPGEDARWDAYVHHHKDATFFHQTGWRKVVQDVFKHEPACLVAQQGPDWVGVLPLFKIHSPFVGRSLISVPYGVYGGVLADGDGATDALLQYARRVGEAEDVGYVELRQLQPLNRDMPTSDLYFTYRRQLPGDAAEILPTIKKRARAEVRRARDRFHLTCETTADLTLFYRLFVADKQRLGSPPLPRRWLQALREEFGDAVVVHLAKDEKGEPLAAVMSFCFKGVLYAYYSGSVFSARRTGVNDFIYCRIMEWCVENDQQVFDFGRSRRDSGAAQFKKNMGFEPQPLHYQYFLLREGARLPDFNPSNPKLQVPRRIWSHLPEFVARSLSGRLSRYLP